MRKLLTLLPVLAFGCSDAHVCLETIEASTGGGSTSSSTSGGESSTGGESSSSGESSSTGGESSSSGESSDDIAHLSDDFDNGPLDNSWVAYRPQDAERLEVTDGALQFEPAPNTSWYGADTAAGLYKSIEGPFAVTAHVRVSTLLALDWADVEHWQLGGVQIRNSGEPSNAVHLALGKTNQAGAQYEPKSTVNDASQWSDAPWPRAEALLRICRDGALVVSSLADPADGEFFTVGAYSRPELAPVVEAGLVAYADTDAPRFAMSVLSVTFARTDGC